MKVRDIMRSKTTQCSLITFVIPSIVASRSRNLSASLSAWSTSFSPRFILSASVFISPRASWRLPWSGWSWGVCFIMSWNRRWKKLSTELVLHSKGSCNWSFKSVFMQQKFNYTGYIMILEKVMGLGKFSVSPKILASQTSVSESQAHKK